MLCHWINDSKRFEVWKLMTAETSALIISPTQLSSVGPFCFMWSGVNGDFASHTMRHLKTSCCRMHKGKSLFLSFFFSNKVLAWGEAWEQSWSIKLHKSCHHRMRQRERERYIEPEREIDSRERKNLLAKFIHLGGSSISLSSPLPSISLSSPPLLSFLLSSSLPLSPPPAPVYSVGAAGLIPCSLDLCCVIGRVGVLTRMS